VLSDDDYVEAVGAISMDVLSDDDYVEAVGAIIERDFFTDPSSGASSYAAACAPAESLDEFLAHTTSEDNVSFDALQARTVAAQRRAWWWAHATDQLLPDDRAAIEAYDQAKQAHLTADAALDTRPGAIETWPHSAANALHFPPGGAGRKAQRLVPRLADRDGAERRARLADSSSPRALLLAGAVRAGLLGAATASRSKRVVHAATRVMPPPPPPKRRRRAATPLVRQYLTTPLAQPGAAPGQTPLFTWGSVDATPLALRGDVSVRGMSGRPSDAARGSSAAASGFRVRPTSEREALAHRLARKVSRAARRPSSVRRRGPGNGYGGISSNGGGTSTTRRSSTMMRRPGSSARNASMRSALRRADAWTPRMTPRLKATKVRGVERPPLAQRVPTSRRFPASASRSGEGADSGVTDGLLK